MPYRMVNARAVNPPSQRPKILIIENDKDIRELLEEILESEGYHPLTAANGAEAFKKLENEPRVSLILLDLMMPGMNGWTFLETKKASAAFAAIPVLLLTAVGDEYLDENLADGLIRKPLILDQLLTAVHGRISDSTALQS
jgi:CheY-like chemotaxis protein